MILYDELIRQRRIRAFIALKTAFDKAARIKLVKEEREMLKELRPLLFKTFRTNDIYFPYYNDTSIPNTIATINFDNTGTCYTLLTRFISKKFPEQYETLKWKVIPFFEKALIQHFLSERYKKLYGGDVPLL